MNTTELIENKLDEVTDKAENFKPDDSLEELQAGIDKLKELIQQGIKERVYCNDFRIKAKFRRLDDTIKRFLPT